METARGPKPASANYGFQVGAKQTGASNTAICKMLLAADTPAPSRSSMQAAANKVGEVIIETNEKDMANIRNDINWLSPTQVYLHCAPSALTWLYIVVPQHDFDVFSFHVSVVLLVI